MTEQPTACIIEIYQTKPEKTDDTLAGSILVPNEIRINGHPVLTQGGVKIQEIDIPLGKGSDLVRVTLTLIARRVIIAAEGDISCESSQ